MPRQDILPLSVRIVDRIIADLCNRRGLRDAWESIDEETIAEIRTAWALMVSHELTRTDR